MIVCPYKVDSAQHGGALQAEFDIRDLKVTKWVSSDGLLEVDVLLKRCPSSPDFCSALCVGDAQRLPDERLIPSPSFFQGWLQRTAKFSVPENPA